MEAQHLFNYILDIVIFQLLIYIENETCYNPRIVMRLSVFFRFQKF